MNIWQNDILKALENEGSFDMVKWKNLYEKDEDGFAFMENVAYDKREYEYLSKLGLVNRGFCPITGEIIDNSDKYSIFGRTVHLSSNALEIGKVKKDQRREKIFKENPNFKANQKKASAFLNELNPNYRKPKYDDLTFWSSLLLSGFLPYIIIKPDSFLGYTGVVVFFIIIFNILDKLRKKL